MIKMKIKGLLALAAVCGLLSTSVSAKGPAYRLPTDIQPTFQQISLKVDPDNPDYTGHTSVAITVKSKQQKIGFYQKGLVIDQVDLQQGSQHRILQVKAGDYSMNWASDGQPIGKGKYTLSIRFHGKVNTSSEGMYLGKYEGRNYIFTQFEDMYAREAFPSFDEPSFKIPYQLTIQAPEKQTVVSNTPVNKRTVKDGWQTVAFDKTKPMPSYIIAYAVGEFDSMPITNLSVPGKIYTPKGKAGQTKFIAAHTAEMLKALEGFFGMKYPYKKLDFIAVPNFTYGAMENAGLVTFRSSLLLLDDNPSLAERGFPLEVVAHEMSHMWYGDLVTMAWWDDLWLNEAFASWMASKVMIKLYPELNVQNNLVQQRAFGADASPTTKPIKKVVRSQADVMDGLGLNYSKGESVLLMIESLIGHDAFQRGIQNYIKKMSWKNAHADDLWNALDKVSDIDIPALMRSYIQQPGYALVTFDDSGKVSQQRYAQDGVKVKPEIWQVPLAITYKQNGKIKHTRFLLKDQHDLIGKIAEAQWIFPDAGAHGYYRWKISNKQLQALLADVNQLSDREKKSLIFNSQALVSAGKETIADHFKVLGVLAKDDNPMVINTVMKSINHFNYLVDDSNRQAFGHYIEKVVMPWFDKLGTSEKSTESEQLVQLRYTVFGMLTARTDNAKVLAVSRKLTKQFLADPTSVPQGIASRAMRMVSRIDGDQWFKPFMDAYHGTTDARVQSTIVAGFGFKNGKDVSKILAMALTDDVTPANTITNLAIASRAQDKRDLYYQWLKKHFIALTHKMPSYHVAHLPEYTGKSCSQHNLQLAASFYPSIMDKYDGMARSYQVTQQGTKQCIALKAKYQPALNDFLAHQ